MCLGWQEERMAWKTSHVVAQQDQATQDAEEAQDMQRRCAASEAETEELRQRVVYQEAAWVLLQVRAHQKPQADDVPCAA